MGQHGALIMAISIVGAMGFIPRGSIGEKVCIINWNGTDTYDVKYYDQFCYVD